MMTKAVVKFPRKLVRIDNCLAFVKRNGKANRERPYVNYEGEAWIHSRLSYHLNIASIPRKLIVRNEGWVYYILVIMFGVSNRNTYILEQQNEIQEMLSKERQIIKSIE